jgi:hypothetical protein
VSVTTGTMTLAKTGSYGNQNVVVPQSQAFKLASFVLTGNTSEDINLNNISVDFAAASGTSFTAADLTDVFVKYGTVTGTVKATVNATDNSWSVSQVLAKNAFLTIEVWGKIGSGITTATLDSITSTMTVSGTTALSSQSASSNTTGQVISSAAGRLTTAIDASTASSKIVSGNQTIDVASFKFNAVNDAHTITEIVATTTATGATAIVSVILKDGATTIATVPFVGTTVTFSGLSIAVPANTSKVLTVALQIDGIGSGMGQTGANAQVSMTTYKANTSQGTPVTQADESGFAIRSGNTILVYKSIPTITNVTLPSTVLAAGTNTLGKFTVAADAAGAISWNKILFTFSKSSDLVLSNVKIFDEAGAQVLGTATLTGEGSGSTTGTVSFVPTTEQGVSGSKTYSLKADVSGIGTGFFSITTNITQPSVFITSTAAGSVTGTASFVWSDNSAAGHDTTTADWTGDFLVKNLATDSQTISVNN